MDEEKSAVAKQLRVSGSLAQMRLSESKLVVGLVSKAISNYPPGGNEIT